MDSEKKYWLDNPSNTRKVYYGLWVACILLALVDLFYHKHGHYGFEEWFGFFAFFGFVACVGLVLASKGLRRLVMRDEDYYDG
jgi:hypothetical protein